MLHKFQNISIIGLIILGYCLVILLVKIALPTEQSQENIAEYSPEQPSVHWSYGGYGNPTRWGKLKEEYALCETGNSQSPVDIATKNPNQIQPQEKSQPIQFNYQLINFTVKNNGHTIQVDYPPGSYMLLDGKKYNLLQFHFHTPSEHLVNEVAAAMEIHLVHQNAEGQLAVVGVLIEAGEEKLLPPTNLGAFAGNRRRSRSQES
jgi:carbonic anhydrase